MHPPAYDPSYQGYQSKPEDDDRFQYQTRTKWNDVSWLVLFVAHLALMVFLSVSFGPDLLKKAEAEAGSASSANASDIDRNLYLIIGIFAGAAAAGLLSAAAWMAVAKRFADSIIKLSLYLSVGFNVLMAFIAIGNKAVGLGILFLIFAGLTALYFYFVRNRIRFAAVMLELSVNAVKDYSGPVWVAFGFVVLEFAWVIFWAFTFLAVFDKQKNNENNNIFAFLLLVSFYWTAEVLKNIVHVTTAGVAATWWFFAEPRSPTMASFKRATTTSLGSICFGSLIVAVVSALKAMLDAASRSDERSCAQECLRCLVSCIEDLVKYFNVYAFSRVAIYGTGFVQAGKETFELFKSKGFDLIVNDDLTGTVLAIGALVGFAVSGGLGAAIAGSKKIEAWAAIGVISGLIGYFMVFLVMNVLRSCVATFFITWAEEPHALQQSRPVMFAKLSDAVHRLYPQMRAGF